MPNYQIIEVDTIISTLQKTFEDIPIGFIHDNLKNNKLPQFLNLFIEKNVAKNGKYLGFIINADSILPEDLYRYFGLDNLVVYYFINKKLTPRDILDNCRKYDDMMEWTSRRTDEQILEHMKFYKQIETKIVEQCSKYGFKCIDTSYNRDDIFESLLKDIIIEIKR